MGRSSTRNRRKSLWNGWYSLEWWDTPSEEQQSGRNVLSSVESLLAIHGFGTPCNNTQIKLQKLSGLDPKCAWAFNYATVNDYFEKLTKVIKDNNIPWENIYKRESNQEVAEKVMEGNTSTLAKTEGVTWFEVPIWSLWQLLRAVVQMVLPSSLVSSSQERPLRVRTLTLMMIYGEHSEYHHKNWDYLLVVNSLATSENGWTSDALCVQWFKKSFVPQAMARNKTGQKILLIFNCHGSHITDKMIEVAIKNNTELFCLPPPYNTQTPAP